MALVASVLRTPKCDVELIAIATRTGSVQPKVKQNSL